MANFRLEAHTAVQSPNVSWGPPVPQQPIDEKSQGAWMVFNAKGTTDGTKSEFKTADHHDIVAQCSPMEYFACSTQSCLQVMIHLIAGEKKMQIGDVSWTFRVGVAATGSAMSAISDTPRTMLLTADLQVEDQKDAAQVDQLMAEVKSRCPMYTLCKDVGIDIALEYVINGNGSAGVVPTNYGSSLTQFELRSAGKAMQSTITTADSRVVVVDEPKGLGGTDTGGNPMDMLGAAMQSALHRRLLEVTREKGIVLGVVEWTVGVGIDVEGLMGVANAVVRPQSIAITACLSANEINYAQLRQIAKEVETRCGILNLIKSKGIATDIAFTIKK